MRTTMTRNGTTLIRVFVLVSSLSVLLAPQAEATSPVCPVSLHETAVPAHYGGARNIAVLSPTNIYTAGPSALHWDGHRWSALPSLALQGELNGVSAVSSSIVWFAGMYYPPRRSPRAAVRRTPLLARWDGRHWHTIFLRGVDGQFENVHAISRSDVWAVGETDNGHTIIAHWNGRQLVRVAPSLVNGSTMGVFLGIAGISRQEIWVVGASGAAHLGTIERWHGRRWSVAWTSPNTVLTSVTALSARDVWAVGSRLGHAANANRPLVLHWDGSAWHEVSVTELHPGDADLRAVTAVSGRDVWAVGQRNGSPLIVHWNGHALSPVSIIGSQPVTGTLQAVAYVHGRVWASGYTAGRTATEAALIVDWPEGRCV